ncbi:hypothetical protein FKW77_008890 [Venturia effusa]|uniref:SIMPL domain-containing protein n=1 Tax=Venturia effusa TaxID=50376 RepID=A0A517L1X1_9PEZI|nr:hypothetical protein FKW77_008890 [Venturia effusa]
MSPLIIKVDETSTISRRAERAVVSVQVSSSGPDQQQVASEVTAVAKSLQDMLRELSKTEAPAGSTASEYAAPITHWSMNTLSTGSYMIYHDDDRTKHDSLRQKSRQYNAQVSLEIKFADFSLLGSACTDLATMPFVSVRNIDWRLTDKTKASLVGMSRKLAVEAAVSKAKDFAGAVGKTTVTAVEIVADRDNGYSRSARVYGATRAFGAAEVEDALNFEPEDVDMTCSVHVKFEAE